MSNGDSNDPGLEAQTGSESAPQFDQAPPRLVRALRDLVRCQEPVFIPRELDRSILARARAHLEPARQAKPRPFWWFLPWLAAGTAALLLARLAVSDWPPRLLGPTDQGQADLDGNGQVDILDAFLLARALKEGGGTPADINGDGRINQEDIDALAARAVRLGGKS